MKLTTKHSTPLIVTLAMNQAYLFPCRLSRRNLPHLLHRRHFCTFPIPDETGSDQLIVYLENALRILRVKIIIQLRQRQLSVMLHSSIKDKSGLKRRIRESDILGFWRYVYCRKPFGTGVSWLRFGGNIRRDLGLDIFRDGSRGGNGIRSSGRRGDGFSNSGST